MINQRSVTTCAILSIVTCGIYGIYWMACLNDETDQLSGEQQPTGGGMVVLLTIVTCGIYGIYWCYKQGEKLERAGRMRGLPAENNSVIYLILAIVGLNIVSYAMMQDTVNKLAAANVAYGQPPYGQPPYGQPPYGQQPYGQQPYGQQPNGQQQPNDRGPYNP